MVDQPTVRTVRTLRDAGDEPAAGARARDLVYVALCGDQPLAGGVAVDVAPGQVVVVARGPALAVEPLRVDGPVDPRYVQITLARLQLGAVTTRIHDLKSKIQRINPVAHKDEYFALAGDLLSLEQQARALRDQAVGGL